MKFHEITDFKHKHFKKIYSSYSTTFPIDERRNLEQFLLLFDKNEVKIIAIIYNQIFVGYAIIWQLPGFYFLEHFEVFSEFRNQKLGSSFMQNISKKYTKLILESEPENINKDAKRRIFFYERNAFHVLDKNYWQPAYSKDKISVNLWLMGNYLPENLEFEKNNIIKVVYLI